MKKVQYIIIDSQYVTGVNNNFTVTFGTSSNTFIQEMRDVIGIRVVDFYLTDVGTTTNKYVDVVCLDVPTAGQLLTERSAQVLIRVPLERNNSNTLSPDKQWISPIRQVNYFNPITIKQLRFRINALQGSGTYIPLQTGVGFYMILEVTTMDHEQPPEDTNLLVVAAIRKLSKRMDKLNVTVTSIPVQVEKKLPVKYLAIIGVVVLVLGFIFSRILPAQPPSQQLGISQVQGLRPQGMGLPQVQGLRPQGHLPQGLL